MRDRQLYAQILGVREPWLVTDVVLDRAGGEVRVLVGYAGDARVPCPQCAAACSRFGHRLRRFRHLDTCQYRTILEVEIPRADCPEHGVHQIAVPWAEPWSRFTALF